MIAEVFCFFTTVSCFVVVCSANCNYCKNGNNGAKTTYITPPCYAPYFPRNKDVGTCSRAFPFIFSSSEARCINDVSTLVLGNGDVRYDNLTNFGTFLQARLFNRNRRPFTLSGGVAYGDEYVLYEDQFFWASSVCGLRGLIIDGQSTPLIVVSIYFNREYGFFEEALKYANGLMGTVAQVQIRSYPNSAFDQFGRYILQVKTYGSSTTVPNAVEYPWFVVSNGTSNYYAFPGQYLDQYGALYDSITYVVFPLSTSSPYIGKGQFEETFLKLLNRNKKPSSTGLATNRRCNRPLVCAQGTRFH